MIDVSALVSAVNQAAATYVEQERDSGCRRARKRLGPIAGDDWRRINALPRREWSERETRHAVDRLSGLLRHPQSSATLRPIQAQALVEMVACLGLAGALRVGSGKTLITLLAPLVMGAVRPLLLVPAKLRDKTAEERDGYARDWRLPSLYPVLSFERLARTGQADYLEDYRPDLIVVDEAHRLGNLETSAARRVRRYLAERPDTSFVALSGTLTDGSIRDYAHLVRWALGDGAPVPTQWAALESWADALDAGADGLLGCLSEWGSTQAEAREGYRDRLTSTPGFLATTDRLDIPLTIRPWRYTPPDDVLDAVRQTEATWETPGGEPIADGLSMARAMYTIALGYYLRWVVPPPAPWIEARRQWCAYVRHAIRYSRSRPLDTEQHVVEAVQAGDVDDGGLLEAWLEVRPTFKPLTEPVWISDEVVRAVCDYPHPAIVWYSHRAFASRLADMGVPVYGQQGKDEDGNHLRHESGNRLVAASMRSSGEGLNLQQFCRSLVLEPPPSGKRWEQLLGRTHRDGQRRPVYVDVYAPTERHDAWLCRARKRAEYQERTLGQPQKFLYADNTLGWDEDQ